MKPLHFALSAIIIFSSSPLLAQEPADEREYLTGEQLRHERWEWYQKVALDPNARIAAWRAARDARGQHVQGGAQVPAFRWENLGPHNQSGRVVGLMYVPTTREIVAATSGGGVWKRGRDTTWRVKTDDFPTLKMMSSAMAPTNPAIMAAGTDEGLVYLSKDSGSTWMIAPGSPGRGINYLIYHPKNASVLYACGDYGITVTSDGGASWQAVAGGGRARSLHIDPTNPNIMYFGRVQYEWPNSTVEIMKSTDAGATFTTILKNTQGYWSDVLFTMCESSPTVLWAGFDSEHKYYRSTNSGATWDSCKSRPWADSYTNGFWMCAADPNNPTVCFAGGPGLFRTTNRGDTWTRCDSTVHADFHALAFLPGNRAVVGCDGGVYETGNYLAAMPLWTYRSYGLETLEAYNVAASPTDVSIVTGCQDNGYDKFTGDPQAWRVIGGDGFACLFNQQNPNIFYHEYCSMNIHRADDGFSWWSTKVMHGLPNNDNDFYGGITGENVDWYGQAIAIARTDGNTLYCGAQNVYATADGGNNWTLVGSDVLATPGAYMTAMAVSPVDENVVYAGSTDGQISASIDGGSTWRKTGASSLAGSARVFSIACHPRNPLEAVASISASTPALFRTTNGGVTWDSLTRAGIAVTSPRRLLYDEAHPDTMYLGTLHGLYARTSSTPWQLVSGLPSVEIWDLAWEWRDDGFGGKQQALLVGSYGRGIFRGVFAATLEMPTALALGDVRVGKQRDTLVTALLKNTTNAAVTVNAISTNDPEFTVAGVTFPHVLAPGATLSATIRFRPTLSGTRTAALRIDHTAGGSPSFVTLSGTGSHPALAFAPQAIDFGTVVVGSTHDTAITVSLGANALADDSVHLFSSSFTGIRMSAFSLLDSVASVITGASGSTALRLRYHPMSTVTSAGTMALVSDDMKGSDTIALHGAAQSINGVRSPIGAPGAAGLHVTPQAASTVVHATCDVDAGWNGASYSMEIVDAIGRRVQTLAAGRFGSEEQVSATVDVHALSPGMYAVRLQVGGSPVSVAMVMVVR